MNSQLTLSQVPQVHPRPHRAPRHTIGRHVLCAVDLSPATERVVGHAAGFARLLGAELKIIHVAPDDSMESWQRAVAACPIPTRHPHDLDPVNVEVRTGSVPEVIESEARRLDTTLFVLGSSSHNGLVRLVLGSTCEALIATACAPMLLIPPNELDVVTVAERVSLHCGRVLAAVDLTEQSRPHLLMASKMARLASQPLIVMTVANARVSDAEAVAALRERVRGLSPVKPRSLIVRRGNVADEISLCASAEGAGLVVMGLRRRPQGLPHKIAVAVLRTGPAFVLAVPSRQTDGE